MVIAVNTRFLLKGQLEGVGYFLQETLSRITRDHPEHQFIFIFDRAYDPAFIFASNVKAVVTGPPARHPVLWKWWFDVRVPAVLKKYKADVFVSADGFCSLTTKIPQCLVIHDLAFLHYPEFFKSSHARFYTKYTGKFIQKATQLATVSEFSKKDIMSQFKKLSDEIMVIPNAARDSFQPLDDNEKKKVKQQYTGGKEYFLYAGAIHPRKNLINLLRAFSIFKKRQGSQFKLVLAGRLAWKYESFIKDLKTYKYRDDVLLTGYLDDDELARLTASAYAMVYPSLWEGFGLPVLEAMRCHVPVITSKATAMEEIAGEAALFADPKDHTDIAEQMMLIYKDETLRSRLIEKGKQIYPAYSWDKSAELLWNCIRKAVGQV